MASQTKSGASFDSLISWVGQKLKLFELELTWTDESNAAVIDFLSDAGPKTLSVVKVENGDEAAQIRLSCDSMGRQVEVAGLVAYFLRPGSADVDIKNIGNEVQYGTIGKGGLSLAAFERVMKGLVEK